MLQVWPLKKKATAVTSGATAVTMLDSFFVLNFVLEYNRFIMLGQFLCSNMDATRGIGSIPGLTHWIKGSSVAVVVAYIAAVAQVQSLAICHECNFHMPWMQPLKKKKKKKKSRELSSVQQQKVMRVYLPPPLFNLSIHSKRKGLSPTRAMFLRNWGNKTQRLFV